MYNLNLSYCNQNSLPLALSSEVIEYKSFSLQELLCKLLRFPSFTSSSTKQHKKQIHMLFNQNSIFLTLGLSAKRKRKDCSDEDTTLNIKVITYLIRITTSATPWHRGLEIIACGMLFNYCQFNV